MFRKSYLRNACALCPGQHVFFSVFSGCCVHISKVILSLRLCLGILGRAGIVYYLPRFCADLVCNCMHRRCAALGIPDRKRCCLTKAVEDTFFLWHRQCRRALPLSIFRPSEIVDDSNKSFCTDWTQTWCTRQALDLWVLSPTVGRGYCLNKSIPMNKKWFAVGQSLPVLVSLFFVGA